MRFQQFFKFENLTPVPTPAAIIDPTAIYAFLLKKRPSRLPLRLKLKSDTGSGFSQIFDSGPETKTQNPAGVASGTPDPVPPLQDCIALQFVSKLADQDWIGLRNFCCFNVIILKLSTILFVVRFHRISKC